MENRRAQLDDLTAQLGELCALLAHDPECQWRRHFASCLRRSTDLAEGPLEQQELNLLSGSVMSVYGGMGSFNDYAPFKNGRLIAGMDALDEVSGNVYPAALSLRVVASPSPPLPLSIT